MIQQTITILLMIYLVSCKSLPFVAPVQEKSEKRKGHKEIQNPEEKTIPLTKQNKTKEVQKWNKQNIEKLKKPPRKKAKIWARRGKVKQKPKKEKTKKYALRYSGAKFIREEKYHPALKKKVVVLSILGAARIAKGSNIISAPIIQILGEDGRLALAPKGVQLYDSLQKIKLTAEYGEYRKYERRLLVKGNAQITKRERSGKILRILADEMERFLAKEESHFEGNVVISREKLNVYADEGTLYEKENRVRLIGNVRIFFGENIYSANKAMLYRGGEKIVLEDEVKLIILANGKTDVVAYGHRADFFPEQEKKGKVIRPQKVYLYASGQQMAQVYYESGWIEAEQVFAQGVHFKFIEAFHQVFFESEKDSVAGFCEKLRRDGEIVFVWGNKNKRPLLYQYENTLLKIAMLAHEIEYRENEEVAFGRGSAQVRIYPKNTYIPKQYLDFLVLPARSDIFGQWAKYELNLDFLTMSGDVRIQEKNSLLRAQSLQMHTKSNRIRFVGNLNGSFKFASTENR